MRGRRGGSRSGSEGEDGRVEVLDGVGIGTWVGNCMSEDGQNLGPSSRTELIERGARDRSGGGRERDRVGRGEEGGRRRKRVGGGG